MPLPVLFGANVEPHALPVGRSSEQALLIDSLGLGLLTVQDHPYQAAFDDTWTLLTFLAARTRHVTLVPTVSSLPLRPPAVLAKAVATLDRLTGSRRTPREAVDALESAITVIRAMWSGERSVRTHGAHYALAGVHPGPAPSDALPTAVRRIDDAALAAGRDPDTIRRVYNIAGVIPPQSAGPFQGPASQWAEHLVALVRAVGMNAFVIWPERDHTRQISAFAAEVVPAVREALARKT
ncbi:coenzyme F420-dependent N(5),N(10)-methylenetetrahydromethanopterin reductase [Streptomyces lincolnensis]|uniref:Coenzyme F420-dependent N(5),N(10)-methylenetetrahydromethanopterin reductase n=2 Tax=Streptomyces lincolnensis TaxID=1915 RepID=A0A1B1M2R0_STRLN|nr:coenzyme F420-dependent N(5),N(10)-methylenetetrahydromethanopterin reductase [Streptomyces lincolnensis]AXG51875.1 coenzyme F420-dependent N(5),N(10)-methylenetetrahydromethanopterin reductase [Streptomyces lincolnensis]QMV12146.1 LLM class flavin-dependent oxidoreductase [Streptomyces lincolnensis]